MHAPQIQTLFERFHSKNPHPKTELIYHSPFELLVSVILSAQATDVSVNKATGPLFARANTPEAIVAMGEGALREAIKSIGLCNTKARNVYRTAQLLIEVHNSTVPRTREALERLPGVGRKTANVVLNTAFGEPTIAVDTHIFRVANRLGLANARTPLATEKQLLSVIPKPYLADAHHWLILHGRYVCKARRPECTQCHVADLCPYPHKEAN